MFFERINRRKITNWNLIYGVLVDIIGKASNMRYVRIINRDIIYRFADKYNLTHGDIYDYANMEYSNADNPSIILCDNPSRDFVCARIVNKGEEQQSVNIKFYFTIDIRQILKFFDEYVSYCYENGIGTLVKSRIIDANDMVTIRIADESKIDEIAEIINKYKKDYENENPFIGKYNGIGITYDNRSSYNEYISRMVLKLQEQDKEISFETIKDSIIEDANNNSDSLSTQLYKYNVLMAEKKDIQKEEFLSTLNHIRGDLINALNSNNTTLHDTKKL